MKPDLKFISLAVLLLLLGFGGGYFMQKTTELEYVNPDIALQLDDDCALNEAACETALTDTGAIRFSIEPRPIYGISPLLFKIDAQDIEIKSAVIDLSGTDMNMGTYRFKFKAAGARAYQAEGNLPVCIRNQMQWQADIWLDTEQQGLIKVPYTFTAAKH